MQSDWSRVFSIATQKLDFSQPCGFYRFLKLVSIQNQKIILMGQIFLQNLYCRFFFRSLSAYLTKETQRKLHDLTVTSMST